MNVSPPGEQIVGPASLSARSGDIYSKYPRQVPGSVLFCFGREIYLKLISAPSVGDSFNFPL